MTESSLPAPLVPREIDLRDFHYMPLDVRRLLASETWIEAADRPRIGHAAMCLWCESWHQVPAASLPDNDKVLARLAMCSTKEWLKIKAKVLRGFVECDDGRLYHPVVAEKALEAWQSKLARRQRTKNATEERERKRRERDEQRDGPRDDSRDEQRDVDRNVHQRRGEERILEERILYADPVGSGGTPSGDPVKALFDTAVQILTTAGKTDREARSLVGMWRKKITDERLASILVAAARVTEPVAYITAAVEKSNGGTRAGLC